MLIVSTGCPSGIGPEVSLQAGAQLLAEQPLACVLVGDEQTLRAAADLVGVSQTRLQTLERGTPLTRTSELQPGLWLLPAGAPLAEKDRDPGRPTPASGAAQLAYVETGFFTARACEVPLVTAPVSKSAIVGSGLDRAGSFRGHTEWLQTIDGSGPVTMCFASETLSTSLVTTHLPLAEVSGALTVVNVTRAIVHLAQLLQRQGAQCPKLAVCSLNPHAGESGLLGNEESETICPGIAAAGEALGRSAKVTGPIGAETAYRLGVLGEYDGVVAMYHDQATIPMKLVAFGQSVNATVGLSVPRTSVDHGTAYDIAWQGTADATGMLAALRYALGLGQAGVGT